MSIFPALPARLILRALAKAGFEVARKKGAHVRLIHATDPTRYATVATHSGLVPRSDIASILRQAKLSSKEFLKFLKD